MAAEACGLDLPDPRPGRLVPASARHRAERMERFAAARQAIEGYASHLTGRGA